MTKRKKPLTMDELLALEPSKKEVAEFLCRIANHSLFNPPWTSYAWEELSEYAELTEDDFWEDAEQLSPMDYLYGQVAWKYKDGDKTKQTDREAFNKLSEQAKDLHDEMMAKSKEESPFD